MRAFLPKCLKKFQKHQKLNKDAYLKQVSGRNARKQRLYMLTVKQETHRPWQNERSGKERTQQGKPWRKTKSSEANAVWLQTKDLANYPPNHCHTKSKGILQKPGSGVVSFGRKEINCRGKVEGGRLDSVLASRPLSSLLLFLLLPTPLRREGEGSQ